MAQNSLMSFSLFAVSAMFLTLAGCTPSYVNQENLGTRSTGAEVLAHYAGNSVRYPNVHGGPAVVEAYFGADGTYKSVSLTEPVFGVGTWKAGTGSGPVNMVIQAKQYAVENGQIYSRTDNLSLVVYIQPDGSARADQMGGGNLSQPRPTPGFQAERRWNTLRRQAGL